MPGSRKHNKKVYSTSEDSTVSFSISDKKEKHCKKEIECYSNSTDSEENYNLCDIYNYFKNRLLEDKQLMVAGSDAYLSAVNNITETIPTNHAITFNNNVLNYNIESINTNSPFFVRQSGVYILFFVGAVDSACQFTIFINGEVRPLTCIGTNSGAGQVVSRNMVVLNKDDNVVIRSYISSTNSFKSNLFTGGLDAGNDLTFLMMKIAPLPVPKELCEKDCDDVVKKLSKDKKKLFNCIVDKLQCDKELMVKGFNVTGTFTNTNTQIVPTGNPVVFDTQHNVTGLSFNTTNSSVNILEDGVYKIFFLATTPTPAQFAFAVNNVPVSSSQQGSSKGAGQITIRSLLELKKGDVLNVLNHVSANGNVTINSGSGGSQNNIAAVMTIFKIAPLCKPCIKPVDCKIAETFECYYEDLKTFLLCNECLQITGSSSYCSLVSSALQEVVPNDSFNHYTNDIIHNINHIQGSDSILITKNGLYDLFVDICTDEPLQYCLFINGVVAPSTIFGRDSGANRCLLRQFVPLNKGDVVQVKNYTSYANPVHTVLNAGGDFIGNNVLFIAFLLHPLCTPCKPKPKKC